MWQMLMQSRPRALDASLGCCLKQLVLSRLACPVRTIIHCKGQKTHQVGPNRNKNVYFSSKCSGCMLNNNSCSNAASHPIEERCTYTNGHRYKHRKSMFWGSGIFAGGVFGGMALLISTLFADDQDDGSDLNSSGKGKEEFSTAISTDEGKLDLDRKLSLSRAVDLGRDLVQRIKDETGSPGLAVAVSVDGKTVWSEGLGYADVENRSPCKPETVLRIASISKSITMAAVARLCEKGDLDLDKPVQYYVPEFPEKMWNGEKVTITTRQLLCHMAGIRHYDKKYMKKSKSKEVGAKAHENKEGKGNAKTSATKDEKNDQSNSDETRIYQEMEQMEYYITKKYDSVFKALDLFKDDPLVNKPGSEFLYTTHGWTLVSAVVERAAKMSFEKYMKTMFDELGLENTYLEENDPLIYNRGRHYVKNKKGRLQNAPYVDLSYKWAGGGLVSNVLDIVKFGNAMLYSNQATSCHGNGSSPCIEGFLKSETVKEMWTPVDKTDLTWGGLAGGGYGLGWGIWDVKQKYGFCKDRQYIVSHTGAAIGGSSVLLILPPQTEEHQLQENTGNHGRQPKGVVVSIIVNMVSVSLMKTAFDVARTFENLDGNTV